MNNLFKQNKIILTYFFYLVIGHIFILNLNLNEFPYKYVFSDWLINYEGGFVRRGLFGHINYKISVITKFDLKNIIFFFQVLGYILYFGLIYNFFLKIKINFFWLLIIFSTISFLYPISEIEALGRKDIYILLCFLIFTIINPTSLNKLIKTFLIIFTISSLIHEISFFYLPYYFLVIYFKSYFSIKEKINTKHILLIVTFILFLTYLNLFISDQVNINKIVYAYENLNFNINFGALSWLSKSLDEHFNFIIKNISFKNILRFLYIYLINVWVIIYFIKLKSKIILFSKEFQIKNIFFFLILLSIPIYLIIYDWGRITYITFNFMIILIIYLQNQDLIDLKYLKKKIELLSFKKKILIFFFVCILFGPKLLMSDDLSGLPFLKTIDKIEDNLSLF